MRRKRDKRGDSRTLGTGDYSAAGPNPFARSIFLQAIEHCVPEAMDALQGIHDEPELAVWAEEWGFSESWMVSAARSVLHLWKDTPGHPGLLGCINQTVGRWEPVFPPGPSWNPITEPESAFRSRVEKYIELMKNAPGISRTPVKADPRHFEWLALNHVGRLSYSAIAERYDDGTHQPDISSISRGITDVAALVGLTLRNGPGRKVESQHRISTQ